MRERDTETCAGLLESGLISGTAGLLPQIQITLLKWEREERTRGKFSTERCRRGRIRGEDSRVGKEWRGTDGKGRG